VTGRVGAGARSGSARAMSRLLAFVVPAALPRAAHCSRPRCPQTRCSSASSHGNLRHSRTLLRLVWDGAVRHGAVCIDATCGRGSDTLQLAERAGPDGLVHALDVLPRAIAETEARVAAAAECGMARVACELRSHESFDGLERVETGSVSAVVYNLGWYPGAGADRSLTTAAASTARSLAEAARVVRVPGVVTVTGYFHQAGGGEEVEAVEAWAAALDVKKWSVAKVAYPNRAGAPCVFVCERFSV
jgi:hypothetical protein